MFFLYFLDICIIVWFVSAFFCSRSFKNKIKTQKTNESYSTSSSTTKKKEDEKDDIYTGYDKDYDLGYMPNYVSSPDTFPYNQQFYSSPQIQPLQDNPKCSFPENEAYFIQKSQISSAPSCRLSPLRMSFEKNPCDRPYVDLEPLI
uniref:Uncharacterized protein n=1 Tax=viral metagenome TaxID=1070528 RepID=A0A6C0D013_9ZZZZ